MNTSTAADICLANGGRLPVFGRRITQQPSLLENRYYRAVHSFYANASHVTDDSYIPYGDESCNCGDDCPPSRDSQLAMDYWELDDDDDDLCAMQ